MNSTTYKTPAGLTITLIGRLAEGFYVQRESARSYLVVASRPDVRFEPTRIQSVLHNGDLEVIPRKSLQSEVWVRQGNKKPSTIEDSSDESYLFGQPFVIDYREQADLLASLLARGYSLRDASEIVAGTLKETNAS